MSKQSTGKKLVVVESPTKAKTIRKFLGKDYIVESCMGHIRDLPQSAKDIPEKFKREKWANLGVDVEHDFDPIYCVPRTKTRIVKMLKDRLAEADELILATDEDREGESISWHLVEVLKPKVPTKRMVFHEITKEAIQGALEKFRTIDENLVRAQEARRILDRLVGYTLSPLLWKKVAYGLSAGRVQSVAVRLIAEREHERLRFKRAKYSSVVAENLAKGSTFESKLLSYQGERIAIGKDFDGLTGALVKDKQDQVRHLKPQDALRIINEIDGQPWKVVEVEEKPVSRKPYAPFITSTLQQEANRKLGMSSRETMEVAQKLYERGFITYMRTDSTFLSQQAIAATRQAIKSLFGPEYLPDAPRDYASKKAKGAQEAHEAIRPAGTTFVKPEETDLSGAMLRLYDLIWKRTVASQMVNAQQKQVSVKLSVGDAIFNASGMTVEFAGFLKVYAEEEDDTVESNGAAKEVRLPQLKAGDVIDCKGLKDLEHETKPPARYTEASLVQMLEKEGIGRPSTYAAIIGTIQDRGYVKKMGNALVPTFTALVVTKLLREHLPDYVDLQFTSGMEESLDRIADGDLESVKYLHTIYSGPKGLRSQVDQQEKAIDGENSRSINLDGLPGLSFRIGRYGAYVCRDENGQDACASLPDNQVPGDITAELAHKLIDQKVSGADALGKDPATGLPIYVLSGRYGPYVQLGESEAEGEKPKRMAIPAQINPDTITLPQALALLELPKTLGAHPESGKDVKKGLGRFGPYVVHDGDYRSVPKSEDLFSLDLSKALALLAQPKKARGGSTPIKELGPHPESQEPIQVYSGKYGPYIKVGKLNISLAENMKPEDLTMEMALKMIAERGATIKKKAAPKAKKASKAAAKPKAAPKAKAGAKTASAKAGATEEKKEKPKILIKKGGGSQSQRPS